MTAKVDSVSNKRFRNITSAIFARKDLGKGWHLRHALPLSLIFLSPGYFYSTFLYNFHVEYFKTKFNSRKRTKFQFLRNLENSNIEKIWKFINKKMGKKGNFFEFQTSILRKSDFQSYSLKIIYFLLSSKLSNNENGWSILNFGFQFFSGRELDDHVFLQAIF